MLIQLTLFLLSFGSAAAVIVGTQSAPGAGRADLGAQYRPLPSLREQDVLERGWVKKRWDFVPGVLAKHGYDAWILSMREYAEDTVFRSLVSSTTTFSARRRSLFLFTSDGSPPLYLVDNTAALWETLNTTLIERDPARIAINVDPGVAFSDGLHTGEGRALLRALDPRFAKRTSSCRALAVEVIAARVGAEQLSAYRLLMENVWAMIAEAFSARVVSVGQTTTADLEWWFRERMQVMGVGTWFHPSVDIRRHPSEPAVDKSPEIREGDMLHVDVGITAMGMNTDTQHLCYVLRANETKPPAGLLAGLRAGNGLQDMVRAEMVPGRTGDEVLAAVRRRMREARVDGDIYSHPIGDYGHSAGAVIGMTNMQGGVPESGGLRVLENYWTSVELAARVYVPEWGRVERFELEEDVYWNNETRAFEWVFGQQTKFHLIGPRRTGWLVEQAAWVARWWL